MDAIYKSIIIKFINRDAANVQLLVEELKNFKVKEGLEALQFFLPDIKSEAKDILVKRYNNFLVTQMVKKKTDAGEIFTFWEENPPLRPSHNAVLPLIDLAHTAQLAQDFIKKVLPDDTKSAQLTKAYFHGPKSNIKVLSSLARKESKATRLRDLAPMLEDMIVLPTENKIIFFKLCGLEFDNLVEHAKNVSVKSPNFGKIFTNLFKNFDLTDLSLYERSILEGLMIKTMALNDRVREVCAVNSGNIYWPGMPVPLNHCKSQIHLTYRLLLTSGYNAEECKGIVDAIVGRHSLDVDKNWRKDQRDFAESTNILIEKENLNLRINSNIGGKKFKL